MATSWLDGGQIFSTFLGVLAGGVVTLVVAVWLEHHKRVRENLRTVHELLEQTRASTRPVLDRLYVYVSPDSQPYPLPPDTRTHGMAVAVSARHMREAALTDSRRIDKDYSKAIRVVAEKWYYGLTMLMNAKTPDKQAAADCHDELQAFSGLVTEALDELRGWLRGGPFDRMRHQESQAPSPLAQSLFEEGVATRWWETPSA